MAKRKLPPVADVITIYRRILKRQGYASCQIVADELTRLGFSGRRNNPISRQAVHRVMKSTEEGRELLHVTKERIGRAE